jgi:acrylyl-CoA reductase (NADPH)
MEALMFRAMYLDRSADGEVVASLRELDDAELPAGEVLIDVEYSTVNYKDGLAYAGTPGVVREYPIVPGVDLAGVVAESSDPRWGTGDRVVVNGWRMGERHWGGHAERARVPADWLVGLPESIDTRMAMAIGTAGLTSMLCVLALERHDLTPEHGPVVVTGASGGVGSVAVSLLARAGFEVAAVTGRTEEKPYLRGLGAAHIVDRAELSEPPRPLETQRWAGGVDAVGSLILANVLARISYGGVVAACGLAQGMDLPTSVAPFILRAVTLVGIESVEAPMDRRVEAWERLATDLDRDQLASMTSEVALAELPEVTARIREGQVRGRVVVDVRR